METASVLSESDVAAMDFEALLTAAEVAEIDSVNRSWGPQARLVLATLMHSKSDLMGKFEADPEAAAEATMEVFNLATDYRDHLNVLVEQADVAIARLQAVMMTMAQRGEEMDA